MMRQNDPAMPLWAVLAFIAIFGAAGIVSLNRMQAVVDADKEALAFDSMQAAGLPRHDLCEQAKRTHKAYAEIKSKAEAETWASVQMSACADAAICDVMIGGCP